MLNHILVPLDGSALAERVIPHVIALAKPFNAKITLVHVLEQHLESQTLYKTDPLNWYLRKSAADLYLKRLQDDLQVHQLSIQTIVLEGFIEEKIVDFVHTSHVDLLILSGYGATRNKGWGVSSIVQNILQRIRISTLIIRHNHVDDSAIIGLQYQKLLVALDGSQRAESVLSIVVTLATAYEPEILLVHVVRKPEMARHMPLSPEDNELANRITARNLEEGRKYLKHAQSLLPINAQIQLLVSDNVATTLENVTKQEQIDLLILSAHGYSGEARWPYGSITNRFITDSTIPLLIVQDLQWSSTPLEKDQSNHVDNSTTSRTHNDS